MAVNQKTPLAIISVKKHFDLKSVQQLKGANIGVHPAGSTYIFLKAALAKNGLSLNDIKQSTVSPPYENFLLLNRVNAVPGYRRRSARAGAQGRRSRFAVGAARRGPGHPELWLGHVHGRQDHRRAAGPGAPLRGRLYEGYADVIQDPGAAADSLIRNNPEYKGKKEMLVAQLQADLDYTFFSAHTREHGLGWIDPAQWRATATLYKEQGALAASFDDSKGFDTRFLQQAGPVKR